MSLLRIKDQQQNNPLPTTAPASTGNEGHEQLRSQNEAGEDMILPETNLLRFLLLFCINPQLLGKTSVTDDIIGWPLQKNILG